LIYNRNRKENSNRERKIAEGIKQRAKVLLGSKLDGLASVTGGIGNTVSPIPAEYDPSQNA
jgi:hypothetical protein